jgi:hypothetical protein
LATGSVKPIVKTALLTAVIQIHQAKSIPAILFFLYRCFPKISAAGRKQHYFYLISLADQSSFVKLTGH